MTDQHDDRESFLNHLTARDRVQVQARMLPMTTLTADQITDVRGDYQRYTSTAGVMDAQVAREIGVSSSVISQWRTGTYRGDNERIARQLNDWMESHARRRSSQLPREYVPTRVAENIATIVSAACAQQSMAAIVTPSGCGKTYLLQVLADRFSGHYLYCTADHTPRQFLAAVAETVGATRRRGRGGRHESGGAFLLRSIVDRVRGTNRPLLLDEAHTLREPVFSRIRAIHDQAEIPVIMVGTDEIITRVNDRADGRGQMASRTIQYSAMDHFYDPESAPPGRGGQAHSAPGSQVALLFTREETRRYLDSLKVRFEPGALELFHALACLPNHGCLRTVRRIVLFLRPDAADREQPIRREEILEALTLLFGLQGRSVGQLAARQPPESSDQKTAAG
jgi:DNA transposition AAA+ family ATPase